jgi:hypothetical protein
MGLITRQQRIRLLANGSISRDRGRPVDAVPVVRLWLPDSRTAWLLSEMDPGDEDRVYGLYVPGSPDDRLSIRSMPLPAHAPGFCERDSRVRIDRMHSSDGHVAQVGHTSLAWLSKLYGPYGMPIQRDRRFKAHQSLSGYLDEAVRAGGA